MLVKCGELFFTSNKLLIRDGPCKSIIVRELTVWYYVDYFGWRSIRALIGEESRKKIGKNRSLRYLIESLANSANLLLEDAKKNEVIPWLESLK